MTSPHDEAERLHISCQGPNKTVGPRQKESQIPYEIAGRQGREQKGEGWREMPIVKWQKKLSGNLSQ